MCQPFGLIGIAKYCEIDAGPCHYSAGWPLSDKTHPIHKVVSCKTLTRGS